MPKTPKFTFKRERMETGLAAVGRPHPNVAIKFNKQEVGSIIAPIWSSKDNLWHVRFHVKDVEARLGWKWITLTMKFEDEDSARAYLQRADVVARLFDQFTFHVFDY